MAGEQEPPSLEDGSGDPAEEGADAEEETGAENGEVDLELPESGPLDPAGLTTDQAVRLAELLETVEDAEHVLVLTHDNPDPDAIASAAALAFTLEETAFVETTLAFGGIVGRAENRALIQELGVSFERIDALELPSSTPVALVDTQPRTGHTSLPAGRIAAIVIDHHPLRPETSAAPFADVRPGYGATCSMMVEYMRAARIEPDRKLATALFYGVQSETMDLGREVSTADVSASLYLYPRSDPASISRIRHARVPASYFQSVHEALERARRYEGVICVQGGRLDYPDMVAEMADLFMRVEGVEWTIASGRYHDDLLISVRTFQHDAHAGRMVRHAVGKRGSAGGHGMLAGAQVSLKGLSDGEVQALTRSIFDDFRSQLGVAGVEPETIILSSPAAGGEPAAVTTGSDADRAGARRDYGPEEGRGSAGE